MPKNVLNSLKSRRFNNMIAETDWASLVVYCNPNNSTATLDPLSPVMKHGCETDEEWVVEFDSQVMVGIFVQLCEQGLEVAGGHLTTLTNGLSKMFADLDPIASSETVMKASKHYSNVFKFLELSGGVIISQPHVATLYDFSQCLQNPCLLYVDCHAPSLSPRAPRSQPFDPRFSNLMRNALAADSFINLSSIVVVRSTKEAFEHALQHKGKGDAMGLTLIVNACFKEPSIAVNLNKFQALQSEIKQHATLYTEFLANVATHKELIRQRKEANESMTTADVTIADLDRLCENYSTLTTAFGVATLGDAPKILLSLYLAQWGGMRNKRTQGQTDDGAWLPAGG